MADWYYALGGQQIGPVSDAQIHALIRQGSLGGGDLVWREGMTDWLPVSQVPELWGAGQQYAQQQTASASMGYYNPQAAIQSGGIAPPNYLVQAILVMLCCCQPFGIVAIVYAAQVNDRYQAGDYSGALSKSGTAKKWCLAGMICGIVGWVAFGGLQILIGILDR